MRPFFAVLIAAVFATGTGVVPSWGAPSKTTTKTVTSHKTTKRQGTASKKRRGTASARARTRPGWRASQQVPTPERYKEIQQALMQRGYLSGAATGVWDAQSIDATKRFQQDQSLKPTGKLSSVTLIALGLGPKRDTSAQIGQIRQGPPPEATSRVQK